MAGEREEAGREGNGEGEGREEERRGTAFLLMSYFTI